MKRDLALRLALALCVTLIASEAFLQLASVVARSMTTRGSLSQSASGSAPEEAAAITILCIGDSHTYGLPLPRAESYPSQLEEALSARFPSRRFQVVNLGIPGVNSGYVANRLERQLLQLRPALVIVWVGINNQWNVVEGRAEQAEGFWPPLRRALLRSRLFRLASIAWYTRTGHQYAAEAYGGWYEGERAPSGRGAPAAEGSDPAPGLVADLSRMATIASVLDTPIFFVTYPMKKQRPVNRAIERAAFESQATLVDSNREFEQAVSRGESIRDLIDLSAGPHPTGRLYGHVVAQLVPRVERALEARGLP